MSLLIGVCVISAISIAAFAQSPPTNRAVLDSCVQRVIRAAIPHLGEGRINVTIDSTRDAVLIAAPLYRAATGRGEPGQVSECRARVTEAGTQYRTIGDDRVVRTVNVRVAFTVRAPRAEIMYWAGDESAMINDTLHCGEIAGVERGEGIPAAHAPDPCVEEASALSSLIEPILLAAASATIIILLFTIRGQ